jgi:HEAT repeats
LVPRLQEALDRFLDEGNFYGRDLIASVLAGIEGVAALPALLRASARDLGDDQDSLQIQIIELLEAHRAATRPIVLEFASSDMPELRHAGLWALGFRGRSAGCRSTGHGRDRRRPKGQVHRDRLNPRPILRRPGIRRTCPGTARPGRPGCGRRRRAGLATPAWSTRLRRWLPSPPTPAPQVRSMVEYVLGRLANDEATPALVSLLHDPDPHVRDSAVAALGSVGTPAAVDALLAMAAEEDPQLRAEAAKALAKAANADPRVPAQLAMLARDDQAAVRAATISGLASASSSPSHWGHLLVELANDPDPMVRQRIAVAVRHLAPDAAADILRRYASDPDQGLRRIAATELDGVGFKGAASVKIVRYRYRATWIPTPWTINPATTAADQ